METEKTNLHRCHRREFMRSASIGTLGLFLPGCSVVERIDRGMYDVHRSVTQEDLITGQRTIGSYTRAEQIAEGDAAMRQIVGRYSRLNERVDRRSYNRLLNIFERVHSVSHFSHENWDVLLLPENGFNAFVTGGTHIAVFQGLMDEVQNDAAIAAVIGHEIGHVTANHVFERQQLMIALLEIAVFDGPTTGSRFAYSALNEREADKIGVIYAALSGYDPYAVSSLWGDIAREHGDDWSWFRTHPTSADRARMTWSIADRATQYYLPGTVNPNHYNLVRCNHFWCNR